MTALMTYRTFIRTSIRIPYSVVFFRRIARCPHTYLYMNPTSFVVFETVGVGVCQSHNSGGFIRLAPSVRPPIC